MGVKQRVGGFVDGVVWLLGELKVIWLWWLF